MADQLDDQAPEVDDVPEWRADALPYAYALAAVVVLVVTFAVLGQVVAAWTAHGVPVWCVPIAAGFPVGALARGAWEWRRITAAVRRGHALAARRVVGPPSTWFARTD